MATDIRYLTLLSREFPSVDSASAEIIKLQAIRSLPKGTEHFMSDIHGEHEAFLHILGNASGAIYEKIDELFGNSLTPEERRSLAVLIYYPVERLHEINDSMKTGLSDWYRITMHRLIEMARYTASKYSRSKVRKAMPEEYAYIMEELLKSQDQRNRQHYHDNIIRSIIDTDVADTFIIAFCTFIKRMAVDTLHIVGDIFDRGPHADVILDHLMEHHSVDIQWGNHDVLWMGAAAGSAACVAVAVKNCLQYDNLDMLENAYGINLLHLAIFSDRVYGDAEVFHPRNMPAGHRLPQDEVLFSRMHKAMCVIQFKLEGQLIQRRPEYNMKDRDMLSRVNYEKGSVEIDGVEYPLRDTHFPTIDPKNPTKLTKEEKDVIDQLVSSFCRSEKLQAHARFLYSVGAIYRSHNGNLLYHGCIPCTEDGDFQEFTLYSDKPLKGKAYLDWADRLARQGYFAEEDSMERKRGQDFLWFLWCGRNSPIFGRSHIATFERTLIEDKTVWTEPKNPYYNYYGDEDFCRRILDDFGLNKPWSRIINGHIPVKVKEGEDPRKAGGRLVVIDGGFCKAYQKQTGIAGYTMFFSSHGMRIASHEPFTTRQDAIYGQKDINSHTFIVENLPRRLLIADTDLGEEMAHRIEELKELLAAYRSGKIRTDSTGMMV